MTNNENNDLAKLLDFTSSPNANRPFQYKYGLKISFNPIELIWFSNGRQINYND